MKFKRKYFVNLAIFATGCLAAVVVCEGALRLIAPQQQLPEWYRVDPAYGRAVKPDFHQAFAFLGHGFTMDVRTNSLGMRDVEIPVPVADVPRVLFVGDSFVWGYAINVEDRLDTVLRKRCDEAGQPIQTMNAGVPGWGTIQQAKWVGDHFEQLKPDIIVWVYCGNDQANDREVLSGATEYREGGLFYLPGKAWLRTHSHLYRLLLYLTAVSRQRLSARMQAHDQPTAQVDAQSAQVLSEEGWARTEALLHEFADRFRAQNPDGEFLLAATAPDDPQLSGPLKAISEKIGAHYLDAAELVAAIPAEERRLPWDAHWSPRMHAAMADAIFQNLEAESARNEFSEATPE